MLITSQPYYIIQNNFYKDWIFQKIKNMGLIKEPKNIDLSTKSEPWTEQELADFRKIMNAIKKKNAKRKSRIKNKSTGKHASMKS